MPLENQFVAFVHSPRLDPVAAALKTAFPTLWEHTMLPATEAPKSRKGPQRAGADRVAIRKALTERRKTATGAVLFVVDVRADEVAALTEEFAFDFPVIELVTTRSGGIAEALRPHLEYFGLLPSLRPVHVRDALDLFLERHPDVKALNRALSSADDAHEFEEPRLVLGSLHALYRCTVVWAATKKRNHRRARGNPILRQNKREALKTMIQHVAFDVSDDASRVRQERTWICFDEQKRYYGWHLKWSLAGPRVPRFHCRVHYAVDEPKDAVPVLWIGHCGVHLD